MNLKEYVIGLRRHNGFIKAFINSYIPFRGAGIYAKKVNFDQGYCEIVMPLRWYNKNAVGTQFGGSLYAMTDPFYMLMIMHQLGHDYVVWDKAACIDFIAPGTSTVRAKMQIPPEEVNTIIALAQNNEPVLRHYTVDIIDNNNTLVAQVKKTVYIRKRKPQNT